MIVAYFLSKSFFVLRSHILYDLSCLLDKYSLLISSKIVLMSLCLGLDLGHYL